MRRALALVTIALLLIVTSLGTSIVARQASAQPDVLSSLLVEVRALRAAMEQLASTGPRVQFSMGRLQLQEQRINTLVRRMDEMRDRRTAVELELASKQREIADLEESLRREGMQPEARAKGLRTEASQILQRLQGLQSEEAALGQEIAAEQGRWSEINQRLEDLDRALSRK
jgi:chromosome segregation ATPase